MLELTPIGLVGPNCLRYIKPNSAKIYGEFIFFLLGVFLGPKISTYILKTGLELASWHSNLAQKYAYTNIHTLS